MKVGFYANKKWFVYEAKFFQLGEFELGASWFMLDWVHIKDDKQRKCTRNGMGQCVDGNGVDDVESHTCRRTKHNALKIIWKDGHGKSKGQSCGNDDGPLKYDNRVG